MVVADVLEMNFAVMVRCTFGVSLVKVLDVAVESVAASDMVSEVALSMDAT